MELRRLFTLSDQDSYNTDRNFYEDREVFRNVIPIKLTLQLWLDQS